MTLHSTLDASRLLTTLGLATLVVVSLLASAPGQAQVPGEVQNVAWCTGSKNCLQWTSTPAATQYRVYRGEEASMPCLVSTPLDSCLESIFAAPTTGAGAIPEIPAPGRFYWFIVTAQSGTGEGPSGSVKQGVVTQPRVRNTFGSCPASCTAAPGSCLGASDCCSSNCAGSCQAACCAPSGGFCGQPSDCCSNVCVASLCQPCLSIGQSCTSSASCCSGNCQGSVCAPACLPNGDLCATNGQCCSGTCALGSCQPGCTPAGGSCSVGSQCCTGVCSGSVCVLPSCTDGIKNGAESDVDCGGGTCPACGLGQTCNGGSDCQSQTCALGVCQCGPVGASCTVGSQCCGGVCTGNVCAPVCGDGVVSGTEQCDDHNNAPGDGCSPSCTGEPGYACAGSPSVCAPCPSGFSNCNGSGVDGCEVHTSADASNCGACNNVCVLANATSACVGGACTIGSCNLGYVDCNGQAIDGCEIYVPGNAANCGACGAVCSSNNIPAPTCAGGTCNGACAAGFLDCNGNKRVDGCEVNVASSATDCGGCGIVCSSNHVPAPACSFGICSGACATGFADCDGNKQANGCEVNVASSATDCGGCGTVCSPNNIPSPTCGSGVCNGACAAGFSDCDGNKQSNGCEINVASSAINCGGCGIVCSSNHIPAPTCGSGVCNGACATGFADCDGNKQSNGCEIALGTNQNCAFCGNACVTGAVCIGGTCQIP